MHFLFSKAQWKSWIMWPCHQSMIVVQSYKNRKTILIHKVRKLPQKSRFTILKVNLISLQNRNIWIFPPIINIKISTTKCIILGAKIQTFHLRYLLCDIFGVKIQIEIFKVRSGGSSYKKNQRDNNARKNWIKPVFHWPWRILKARKHFFKTQ